MLPDGSRVLCSRTEQADLFYATLCGLGATGVLLEIKMQVVPRFRLREVQDTRSFDSVVDDFDCIMRSSEFVRMWWFPQDRAIRVSAMEHSSEVRPTVASLTFFVYNHDCSRSDLFRAGCGTRSWDIMCCSSFSSLVYSCLR